MKGAPRRRRSNRAGVRVWSLSNKSISKVTKGKRKPDGDEMRSIEEWTAARSIKDYVTADRIREELLDKGIEPYEHVPRSSLRRATSKLHTPKPRTATPHVDLTESLQDWVTAKRNGDRRTADSIYADLQLFGIDPYMVWPDMAFPSDSEEETSFDEMSDDAAADIIPSEWHVWTDAENMACNLKDEVSDAKMNSSERALAAVAAHDYFNCSTSVSDPRPKFNCSRRIRFSNDLLEKTPCLIQTCDSLLVFLDRKRAALVAAPSVRGPPHLLRRMEEFADLAGRVGSLGSAKNWDARARRILDVPEYAASAAGCEFLREAEECLQAEARALEALLVKEGTDALEDLISERRDWAWSNTRMEFMACCKAILVSRKAMLSTENMSARDSNDIVDSQSLGWSSNVNANVGSELNMVCVFKMLLGGISFCEQLIGDRFSSR